MCGLFGVVGRNGFTTGLVQAIRELALFSVLRGADSTGIGTVNHHKREYTIEKAPVSSIDFLERRKAISLITDVNNVSAFIGHTRAATRGVVSKSNAHPFIETGTYGSILLAHNGCADGYDTSKYNVDSNWVCAMIAEHGPDWVMKLRGEYALTWHDYTTNSLWIARNTKRTLFIADVHAGHNQRKKVWASERKMLEAILDRNHVKIEQLYEVAPHTLYEIDVDTSKLKQAIKYSAPVVEPYVYRAPITGPWNAASPAVTTSPTVPISILPGNGMIYRNGARLSVPVALAWDKHHDVTKCRNTIRVKLNSFNANADETYWRFDIDPTDAEFGKCPQVRMTTVSKGTSWTNRAVALEKGWVTLEIMGAEWAGEAANKKLVTLHCTIPTAAWDKVYLDDEAVIRDQRDPTPIWDEDEERLTHAFARGA